MSIDPLSEPAWDQLISVDGRSTVFHSQAWLSVLAATYRHRFRAVRLAEASVAGAWLVLGRAGTALSGRTAVSVPFADFAPPLLPPGLRVPVMTDEVIAEARRWDCSAIEIRGGEPPRPDAVVYRRYADHVIDLALPLKNLWSQVSDSSRRSVNKAKQAGLEVRCLTSAEGITQYYHLHCLTRRRLGLPPQPFAFFLNLSHCCLAAGKGFVLLAGQVHKGSAGASPRFEPMAGAVYLIHQRQAVYKFGASDDRFLTDRPNHLVMWSAIEKLSAMGIATLNLGRSDLSQQGLLRYKRSWGAVESRLDYYRYDLRRERFSVARQRPLPALRGVISHLPLGLLRSLGRVIYPHLH